MNICVVSIVIGMFVSCLEPAAVKNDRKPSKIIKVENDPSGSFVEKDLVSCEKSFALNLTSNCTEAEYLRRRPDVVAEGISAKKHYKLHGINEGMCNPFGNSVAAANSVATCTADDYLRARSDVVAAGMSAAFHYKHHGINEGMCKPVGVVTKAVVSNIQNVVINNARKVKPSGVTRKKAESGVCTPEEYIKRRPDLASSGMTPYQHYRRYGKSEGMCSPFGYNSSLNTGMYNCQVKKSNRQKNRKQVKKPAVPSSGNYNTVEVYNLRELSGNQKRFSWLNQTGAAYGGQVRFDFGHCGQLLVPNAAITHGADGNKHNYNQSFYFCGTDFRPGMPEYNGGKASVFTPPGCNASKVTMYYNK